MANYNIPEKARVAVLTGAKKIEIFELPVPEIGDDEVLVKVEQTGICGTDVHEWKVDPFGIIPVTLGHEGTGEIVYLGKNIKMDTSGKPIKVGDKIALLAYNKGDENPIPGKIYAVDTTSNGLIIRKLMPDENGAYIAKSLNEERYPDFIIKEEEIIRIFRIVYLGRSIV